MINTDKLTFGDFKAEITTYIKEQLNYSKLTLIEFSARLGGIIITKLAIVFTALFALIFGSIASAYYLSELTDSITIGYSIVAAVYLISYFTLRFLVRKRISRMLANILVQMIDQALKEV